MTSFFRDIKNPQEFVTAISTGLTFPESLNAAMSLYEKDILLFKGIVESSKSSAEVLERIRKPKEYSADTRMSLLKIFRRTVSLVCDTESTKKITKISTESIVKSYGDEFKPIKLLKLQFGAITKEQIAALAGLLAENDSRGQSGYSLTGLFFDWFEQSFENQYAIEGPRGAGKDIELRTIFPKFEGAYPCDFVITDIASKKVVAVGFARYDSTRGGSQSDDRTGGNANKIDKAREFHKATGDRFKIIFLADGPGLTHKDTWEEACAIDGCWDDAVRVTTLKLAPTRVTADWLAS